MTLHIEPTGIKTKRAAVQAIQKCYESKIEGFDEDNDAVTGFLTELNGTLSSILNTDSPDTTKDTETVDAGKSTDEGKGADKHLDPSIKDTHSSTVTPETAETPSKVETIKYTGIHLPLSVEGSLPTSILRKEFRIRGQIGEPNQRDKLAWVSLQHQILEGKEAGYSYNELINGVINAMVPNLTLRNVEVPYLR